MTIKILISRRKLFMKLNKKFLASFTALTMAVTPMAALADTAPNGASSVTGKGIVSTLETEIYNVVLPTSESVAFKVDPYGLLNITSATSTTDTSLKNVVSNAAGTVTSSATAVVNKSSVGIHVDVDVYLDATQASNSAVTLASTKEEAQKGDANLYLEVVNLSGASLEKVVTGGAAVLTDGAVAVSSDAIDLSGKAFTLSTAALAVTGSSTSVSVAAITATGASTDVSSAAISFDLGDVSDAYFVTTTALTTGGVSAEAVLSEDAVTYDSNNVYAFAITGYANPSSDVWQKIQDAKSGLELTLKFTISKQATEPEVVKTADGGTVEFNLTDPSFTFTIDTTANINQVYNAAGTKYTLTGATINGQTVTITNGTDSNSTFLFSKAATTALKLALDDGTTYTVNVVGK
jgi:hypothetical protein